MRGNVDTLVFNNRKGLPYGTIIGENGKTYRFDNKSMYDGLQMSSLYVGDSVEFEFTIKDKGLTAINVNLVSNTDVVETSGGMQKKELTAGTGKMERTIETVGEIKESYNQTLEEDSNSTAKNYYRSGFARSCDSYKLSLFLKPDSGEREILEKFSKVFYVTYINHHDLGDENYFPYCLLGATELIKQYVREKSEFLLVFSHFKSGDWQQKTLRVASQIRQRKEMVDRRPKVNFYLLISNAKTLKAEIDKVKGGTDAAVIPFSFEEILKANIQQLKDLILKRFDEYYFENNMFGEENPIEEDALLFGDRGKIADSIVQRSIEGSYSGIFGLRRSGKSSVLRAVIRRLQYNQIKYIHVESRSFLAPLKKWETALFDIAREIRKTMLGINQGDMPNDEFIKKLKLLSTEEDYDKRPTQCFVNDVKQYVKDNVFVIAIDEIELITYNTATSETWRDLDAYNNFWSALRDCGCTLILCGVNSTINERSNIEFNGKRCDNPMYERIHLCADFSKTYLPAFTDEQTKTMINQLGSYSNIAFNNVYTEINDAFGGQPYPIRQFCAFVFDQIKDKRKPHEVYEVSKAAFEALHEEYSQSDKGYQLCSTILQHFSIYKQEYEKLKEFAFNPEKNRVLAPSDSTIIDHLEKYGIIEYDRRTSHVAFKIHILQDYIVKNEQKNPRDMDNDERRAYIQDAVAECEKKLKNYILRYYLYNSTDEGKRILTEPRTRNGKPYAIKKDRNLRQFDFEDIFDHNKFILYFSTLRDIIYDQWSTLGHSVHACNITKEKFYTIMTDLNAGRSDADHYDAMDLISPDDWEIDDHKMNSFMVAYETLKQFFDKMHL